MTDRPVLLLVTGLPGTGKSTLAEGVAPALGAPVFAWDWMMGALTPYEQVQATLEAMDRLDHRRVGWSLLWQAARAQLRRGQSVVLDGVARAAETTATRALAADCGVDAWVVMTTCPDPIEHRARIEGRDRGIPGWHELSWDDVERTRGRFEPPGDADLVIDSRGSLDHAVARTTTLVTGR